MKYRWTRPSNGESHILDTGNDAELVRVTRSGDFWEAQVLDAGHQWWDGGESTSLTEARGYAEGLLGLARGDHSDLAAAGIA